MGMRGAETQISPERSEKPSFISRIHIMLNSVCKKWRERSEHEASWCNFVAVVTLNDEEFTNLLQLRGMMCFLTLWKSLSINYNIKWNLSSFFFYVFSSFPDFRSSLLPCFQHYVSCIPPHPAGCNSSQLWYARSNCQPFGFINFYTL